MSDASSADGGNTASQFEPVPLSRVYDAWMKPSSTPSDKTVVQTVLGIVQRSEPMKHDEYLLLRKKLHLFGGGLWNGPGGKINAGEDPLDAMRRELFEETGIKLDSVIRDGKTVDPPIWKVAELRFINAVKDEPKIEILMHVFVIGFDQRDCHIDLKSISEEHTDYGWFTFANIPWDQMWPDDIFWLPQVIRTNLMFKVYKCTFWFERNAAGQVRVVDMYHEHAFGLL